MKTTRDYKKLDLKGIWKVKRDLINVTAIQSSGSPITEQLWDTSMAEVEQRVMGWHTDRVFFKGIIRVFVNIHDHLYEYQIQEKGGFVIKG